MPQPIEVEPYGAATADWFDQFIGDHPRLFHVTSVDRVDTIRRHGLLPPAAGVTRASTVYLPARDDCVYLADEASWRSGWLHEWVDTDTPLTVIVTTARLDRRRLVPDEDNLDPTMAAILDPTRYGLPDPRNGPWTCAAHWATANRVGAQPGIVEDAWAARPTIAHLGPIPPDALTLLEHE